MEYIKVNGLGMLLKIWVDWACI